MKYNYNYKLSIVFSSLSAKLRQFTHTTLVEDKKNILQKLTFDFFCGWICYATRCVTNLVVQQNHNISN